MFEKAYITSDENSIWKLFFTMFGKYNANYSLEISSDFYNYFFHYVEWNFSLFTVAYDFGIVLWSSDLSKENFVFNLKFLCSRARANSLRGNEGPPGENLKRSCPEAWSSLERFSKIYRNLNVKSTFLCRIFRFIEKF